MLAKFKLTSFLLLIVTIGLLGVVGIIYFGVGRGNTVPATALKTVASANTTVLSATRTPQLQTTSTSADVTPATPIANAQAAFLKYPLSQEVAMADQVFEVQVTKIGGLVWTTPDNTEPANYIDPKYHATPEQLAPVELTVLVSYKGNSKVGEKVSLLLDGAPGSKPYGGSKYFPKLGDKRIWFVGKELDYRRGLSSNPLLSPSSQQFYTMQSDTTWVAPNGNTLTLPDLENAVKNPAPAINVARPIVPTATPRINPGQTINLVKFYGLDKAQAIYLKGIPTSRAIRDNNRIKSIIAALDKPLTALNNPFQSQARSSDDIAYVVFAFGDDTALGFDYNRKDATLIEYSPDWVKVAAPPDLAQALGWN